MRLLLPLTRDAQELGDEQDDLQGMMGRLKSLAQEISQQHTAQVSVEDHTRAHEHVLEHTHTQTFTVADLISFSRRCES